MAGTDKKYERMLASRRRRNVKKKLLLSLKILLLVIFFVALVWGFNYFYNSNYFKIKSINVSGNNYYSFEEIKKEADVALGLNIFEIDKKSIEDMLVKSLVRLKSASLKKIFPDRIEIQVGEREPFVKVVYGVNYYILDNEGIVLGTIGENDQVDYEKLILVKNGLKSYPEVGEKIAKKNILSCGDIYEALDLEIKNEIREAYISDESGQDIVLVTNKGKQIIIGTSDKIVDKNAILRQVLNQLKESGTYYSVIDLRNIENPVIK